MEANSTTYNIHLLSPIKSESDCERPLLGQWRTAADSADPNAQSEELCR